MKMDQPAGLLKFLENLGVNFTRIDHPPVYTCEELQKYVAGLPGARTKNLFLRDKKGRRHFLVLVAAERTVDIRSLENLLDVDRLSLGSAERLKRCLEVEAGAVSLLALVNDREKQVELVVDRELWQAEALQCHPLVNTSTLVVPMAGIRVLLDSLQRLPRVVDLPKK